MILRRISPARHILQTLHNVSEFAEGNLKPYGMRLPCGKIKQVFPLTVSGNQHLKISSVRETQASGLAERHFAVYVQLPQGYHPSFCVLPVSEPNPVIAVRGHFYFPLKILPRKRPVASDNIALDFIWVGRLGQRAGFIKSRIEEQVRLGRWPLCLYFLRNRGAVPVYPPFPCTAGR